MQSIDTNIPQHKPEHLITLFNECFMHTENTRLVLGGGEPVYIPALMTEGAYRSAPYDRVVFAHGYFASALHEISHWCIAGKQRRLLLDYGYWYEPDGRGVETQAEFAMVESRPQAIEWVLSKSCDKAFHISLDNLSLNLSDFTEFKLAIYQQVQEIRCKGLPPRAAIFQAQLSAFYGVKTHWKELVFNMSELD